jgi:hypothetical protein
VRAVVISPYPPTPDARGDVALEVVRELRHQGVEVDVVSPEPSAARYRARPDSLFGALRLCRITRGADRVVIVGDTTFLVRRTPTSRALARAFSRLAVEPVAGPASGPRPPGAVDLSLATWMERLRSGGPTLLRTVAARVRSSWKS